jgi:hypothetical protein
MNFTRYLFATFLLQAACNRQPALYPVPRLDDRPYLVVDGAITACPIRVLTRPETQCLPPYVPNDRLLRRASGLLADEPTVVGRRIRESGPHPRWVVLLGMVRSPGPSPSQQYRVEPIVIAGLHTGCARHTPPAPEELDWPCGLRDPPPPDRIKRVLAVRGAVGATLYGTEAAGGVLIIEFKH